jgi:hypothetical protein
LVRVEDRDITKWLQPALAFEAGRGRDVLKIDTAEGSGE